MGRELLRAARQQATKAWQSHVHLHTTHIYQVLMSDISVNFFFGTYNQKAAAYWKEVPFYEYSVANLASSEISG